MTKVILALDLGTTTGFAMGQTNGKVNVSLSKNFKATRFQSADRRFINFRNYLQELLSKAILGVDVVYFEEVRRHIGTDAAHCYGGFKAALTMFCEDNGIPYEGVGVGTIKKHITGKGNANKEKVIEAVQELGHNPKDDNEADAIALLYYAIDKES